MLFFIRTRHNLVELIQMEAA